jgi:hypothetical protein
MPCSPIDNYEAFGGIFYDILHGRRRKNTKTMVQRKENGGL